MNRTYFSFLLIAMSLTMGASAQQTLKPYTQQIPGTDRRFEMVPVTAGEFSLGSPATEKDRKEDEGPQVRVRMEPFYIGKFEVTWPEFDEYSHGYIRFQQNWAKMREIPRDKWSDAVTYPTPMYDMETGPHLMRMGGQAPGKPACAMSQYSARQYSKWLSKVTGRFYRLPTEAEWEYACRAGSTTAYWFGDDPQKLKDFGWFLDNSAQKDGDPGYKTVGTKKPNPWGIYDMHGNVGEWCLDQYDAKWYTKFAGKTVGWHDLINWPISRYPCVIRGGGFDSEAASCRSAARGHSSKEMNVLDANFPQSPFWEASDVYSVGFRLVRPAVEPPEAEKVKYWDAVDKATIDASHRDRDAHEIIPHATGKSDDRKEQ